MLQKIILFFFFILNFSALSATEINIKVNGLVCEFCAVTIEKSFKKLPKVSKINIDLEAKNVQIILAEKQHISDQEITDIIINNGYAVVEIIRENDETK
ncbi:MAG: heavy-metal-associated domain-containing protein [Alphaproteobacteria bacterium]|jgi:copper chaperone CopZ|nr:heavy-metal-associated domain-containing protein [Alphaproteobacteria bacterium]MBT5828237.1 heavy-metal-associated domain-containing protein [Alphaproteobacteria bacterium]